MLNFAPSSTEATSQLATRRRLPVLRRLMRAALAVVLAGGVLAAAVLTGTAAVARDNGLEARPVPPEMTRVHTAGTPKGADTIHVAFVLGSSGTEAADLMAPYDVFARSGRFTVTTVAADRQPVQLAGAPAVMPETTFGEIDAGRAPAPDLLVVPAVVDPTGDSEAATRSWITRQSERGIHILGVCAGSLLLAEAGVLDGHRATSHWSRISSLRESRPAVDWTGGQRFVNDGLITTTAGVTSGIPGALELVKELAGPAEAERVGAEIGYPDQSSAGITAIPAQAFDVSDAPVALNAVLPWFRPTIGVGLTDGISELDAAAVFEVYTVSGAARTVALAASTAVTTRHGLVLITTPYTAQTQHLDRLILPGSAARDAGLLAWARGRQLAPTVLTEQSATRGAFDTALEDLAGQVGNATAMTTAKFIDYPTTRLDLQGTTTDSRSIWLLVLTAVLAAGIGALPSLLRRGQDLASRKALAAEPAPKA